MTASPRTQHWRNGVLEDLVFFQRGFDITVAQQEPGPYPVISSSGVTSHHNEYMVNGPGIVIGRKGTLGSIHYTDDDYWPHDTTLWSKDLKGNYPRFVYYYLHTIDFKRFDVGNSNPTLNRNHIHGLKARIPPPSTQRRIADILSAYDDLIDNNRRRMALLEESARQLYQEWFVRLRFPGHEHIRITNGVPEGWQRKVLENCVSDLETGNRPKGGVSGIFDGVPSIGAESIVGAGHFDFSQTKYVPEDYFLKLRSGIVQDRDVLVYKDGGRPGHFTPHVSIFGDGFPFSRMAINSHVYRLRGTKDIPQAFLYYHLSSEPMMDWMNKAGSGAAIPGIARKDLLRLPIVVPASAVTREFSEFANCVLTQIFKLASISKKLRDARDLLLPRLMSGELAV